jgi:hypothetical protein
LVSETIPSMLWSYSDQLVSGWWWITWWPGNGQHFICIPPHGEFCIVMVSYFLSLFI